MLYNSHSGSDFHQVYKNNMDDKSFVDVSKVIDGILTNPNTAFFGTEHYFDDTEVVHSLVVSNNHSVSTHMVLVLIVDY